MEELTLRQTDLLKTVVEDYIKTAKPVGSQELVKNHELRISAATVRNEMAELMRKGFLEVPHTSSGRVPTALGIRHYINELMEEKEVPVLEEVAMKQRVWDERYELDKFFKQAVLALAESSGMLSVVETDDGRMFRAGMVNVLNHPEFFDIDVARTVFGLLDDLELFRSVIGRAHGDTVAILLGSETEIPHLDTAGLIVSRFSCGNISGRVCIIGPYRMPYSKVIPEIRFLSRLLSEVGGGW